MPTHVFQPSRNPPTWWDRLLVHPMESSVATISVGFGIITALSSMIPSFVPSKSMDTMPTWLVVFVAAFLIVGGLLALFGLNWTGDEVSHGWAIERFGWILASGGFAAYAIPVANSFIGSVYAWGIPLMLALACALRAKSVQAIEKSVRKDIAQAKGEV